jgi:hypothetical protein
MGEIMVKVGYVELEITRSDLTPFVVVVANGGETQRTDIKVSCDNRSSGISAGSRAIPRGRSSDKVADLVHSERHI